MLSINNIILLPIIIKTFFLDLSFQEFSLKRYDSFNVYTGTVTNIAVADTPRYVKGLS